VICVFCRVRDVCACLEELAPLDLALEWDNVGLQIGNPQKEVSTILVTLTVTEEIVQKAISDQVDLIVAHHPLIFKPLYSIRTDQPQGAILTALLQQGAAVYVAHTNLDQAPAGLNHWLAREVGLEEERVLVPGIHAGVGLGRIGTIAPLTLGDLAQKLENLWGLPIRIVSDRRRLVSRLAVVGGSGGDFIEQAKAAGAHCLITGDVSYHDALDAIALDLAVLDAGHFATERIAVKQLAQYLQDRIGERVQILQDTSTNPFAF
jgi:dinuclear metal center YbgI/SA1388 family protein